MNDEWSFSVRRVRNKPNFFKGNRVSSALFKDKKGVSVDKDDGRDIPDIVADEERLHRINLSICSLSAYARVNQSGVQKRLKGQIISLRMKISAIASTWKGGYSYGRYCGIEQLR